MDDVTPGFEFMSPRLGDNINASWHYIRLTGHNLCNSSMDRLHRLLNHVEVCRNAYPVNNPPAAVYWRPSPTGGEDEYCHGGRPLVFTLVGRFAAELSQRQQSSESSRELTVVPIRRVDAVHFTNLLNALGRNDGA